MALADILLENDFSTSLACQRVFRDRLNPTDQYNKLLMVLINIFLDNCVN